MNPQPFEVRADAEGVLWLSGELDLEHQDRLTAVAAQQREGHRTVVLDCSGLTFIDSSGLRAILTFAASTPDGVVVRNAPPNVLTVFDIAGIDEALGVRIEPSV